MHTTPTTRSVTQTPDNSATGGASNHSNHVVHALIFLLPLLAGLIITLVLPHYGFASKFGGTGHDGYLELAHSLYNGDGFRFSADGPAVFHRPPLYPALLMPFMGLSETAIKVAVVLINSLFLIAACLYTRRICKLLFPQAVVGTIAMALLICNPWMYRLLSSPLSAIMQMALYTALSFYFLQFCDKHRQFARLSVRRLAPSFLKITLLTTAMCLAHGTSAYVCAAVFTVSALIMLVQREWKLLALLTISASLTLAALSPWALRNQSLLERIELSSSGAGFTYFLGNAYWGVDSSDYIEELPLESNALLMAGVPEDGVQSISYWGVTDALVDQQLRDSMVAHLKENPVAIAKKSLLNLADIYFPITHTLYCKTGGYSPYCGESLNTYQIANRASRTLLMLLIVGLALNYLTNNRAHKPVLAWLAMAGALLHTLPYLPIATYAHHGIYSLGALPLMCSLAAAALYRLRIRTALRTPNEDPQDAWGSLEEQQAMTSTRNKSIRQQTLRALKTKHTKEGVQVDHNLG